MELERLRRSVSARLFHEEQTPLRVGRFEIVECIGRGGMGIVYSARDLELDRIVALKLVREALAASPDDDQLRREAQALARLSHPNVITVFDVGVHEGQRFIAMEFVAGESLDRWLATPRGASTILTVFRDIARGLEAAHRVGLVHRDFKAHNVLVGDDGRPRVLDFGLARGPEAATGAGSPPSLPDEATATATCLSRYGELLGTPAYMSPEQHLGLGVDARSDQFSFGVALYDALFGHRPFDGDDLRSLSLAIVRGDLRFPVQPRLSPRLMAVLRRALAPRAEARFPSMQALIDELEPCIETPLVDDASSRYDTQAVQAVLGRAAEIESAAVRGRGLDRSDVLAIADEAGFDPHSARQALAELDAPASTSSARAVVVRPPAERYAGIETSVVATRVFPRPVSRETAEIIVRELERAEQVRGRIEFLGDSVAWSGPKLEMHLDRTAGGRGQLTLWRRTKTLARRKIQLATPAGLVLGLIVAGIVLGGMLGVEDEAGVLFGVIMFALGGATAGFRLARAHHRRAVEQTRERLEYLADRAVNLLPEGAGESR